MKTFKKISSVLVAAIMLLTLTVASFAANETGNTITVNNASEGENYSIYKMLDLSVDNDLTAYRYTVNSVWSSFFAGNGASYIDIDSQGYVTWKSGADIEEFGKAAKEYASQNSISPLTTLTATSTKKVIFDNLDSGYYLITSTLGTKVIVQTTPDSPTPEINEKNSEPTIKKEVKEDSTGLYGESNTAQIGDTVEFMTTVSAKSGAKKYVIHDKMDKGLTLNTNSITVKSGESTLNQNTDYTVSTEADDGCTFEITFTQAYLDTITADIDITVAYTAVLNNAAVISTDTNNNKTWLTYGDNGKTTEDVTETSTFKFELVKTKSDNTFLNGAKFELYDAKTGGTKIALVKASDGSYRIATDDEKNAPEFNSAVIEAGTVTVKGLDADTTYWLEETDAPVGYNKLTERVEVKLESANLNAELDASKWISGGVHIINNTGNELPSTGGIGTTIFYIVGGALVVGAVILLITKKRMNKYETNYSD